jgi:hypothetical protein
MAHHLCIVSRDNPLLLGYLNIALGYLTRTGDELEIVIDRRPDPGFEPAAGTVVGIEQRHLHGVDSLLRSRGYAIVSRDEGENWRLTDTTIPITGDDDFTFTAPSKAARVGALAEPLRRGLGRAAGAFGGASRRGLSLAGAFGGASRRGFSLAAGAFGGDSRRGLSLAAGAFGGASRRGLSLAAGALGGAFRRGRSLATDSVPAPMRRRLALAAGLAFIVIGGASVVIKSDALARVAGVAGDAVAWLRSTPAPEPPVAPVPPPPTVAAPARPAPAPATPSELTRSAKVAPPAAPTEGRVARAPEPPAVGPARLAKLAAPPAHTDPAPPQAAVKADPRLEPRREATAAVATEAPAEFSGVPRLEMRRVRDASGHTSAIAVRVTDAGGRPLPSADVRILRRINGGRIQETRLTPDARDGSFRGAFPPPTAESDGLSMRVTVGRVSHEVPIAE